MVPIVGAHHGGLAVDPNLRRRAGAVDRKLNVAAGRRINVRMGVGDLVFQLPIEIDEVDVVVLAGAFVGVVRALGVDRGVEEFPRQAARFVVFVGRDRGFIGDERLLNVGLRIVGREGTEHQPVLDDAELERQRIGRLAGFLRLAGLIAGIGDRAIGEAARPGLRRRRAGIAARAVASPTQRRIGRRLEFRRTEWGRRRYGRNSGRYRFDRPRRCRGAESR